MLPLVINLFISLFIIIFLSLLPKGEIMDYSRHFNIKKTPQSQPIPGRESEMVVNNAGGVVFGIDEWTRLDRFLILGSEGGTYYANEQNLTVKNAKNVLNCIKKDGVKAVLRIVQISRSGRAPKNDAAIFALALCLKLGDLECRQLAAKVVPSVCRIGTHLFQLAQAVKALGGWGRGTRRAFQNWYLYKNVAALSYQVVKYQQRAGWSHRDVLRLAHPKATDARLNAVLQYATTGTFDSEAQLELIEAVEHAKKAESLQEIVMLINNQGLPRECIPTKWLNEAAVWEALLQAGHGMPMTAMIRNLGKMTKVGLIAPMSDASRFICNRLRDGELLEKARIHPVDILIAMKTYG